MRGPLKGGNGRLWAMTTVGVRFGTVVDQLFRSWKTLGPIGLRVSKFQSLGTQKSTYIHKFASSMLELLSSYCSMLAWCGIDCNCRADTIILGVLVHIGSPSKSEEILRATREF
jgi:hypothetical protein